ncbi:MAG: V-type ATP synthase subunit K, partial [Methanomicrobiales archaeon]|nr:V-type ATP synthase subunit K [Methanomicrobiales archaeon]
MTELTLGAVLAIIGAGLAVGLSAIGSGIGVGIAGAAAAGSSVARKEKFSTFLIFQAVPQTQAIYGLLVGVLILLSTGLLGGGLKEVPLPMGMAALGAGVAVGLAGLSAIGQGITAASGIAAASRDDTSVGRGLVFSVIPETQAIYGLLTAILILSFTGFLTEAGEVGEAMGWAAIGAGFAVGFAGLSAIGQGITAASGITASVRKPGSFGKSLVFSVIPETQAIYG